MAGPENPSALTLRMDADTTDHAFLTDADTKEKMYDIVFDRSGSTPGRRVLHLKLHKVKDDVAVGTYVAINSKEGIQQTIHFNAEGPMKMGNTGGVWLRRASWNPFNFSQDFYWNGRDYRWQVIGRGIAYELFDKIEKSGPIAGFYPSHSMEVRPHVFKFKERATYMADAIVTSLLFGYVEAWTTTPKPVVAESSKPSSPPEEENKEPK